MQRLELIMGRNIPDNGKVTDVMMNDFIKEYIIPFFDYGTFIDGELSLIHISEPTRPY